jgi:hypothetical protein
MVRASSLADGGAKVAATVKRSTWNSGLSCGGSVCAAAAAMTSAGAVSGAVPAISSGIKDSFLLLLIYEV